MGDELKEQSKQDNNCWIHVCMYALDRTHTFSNYSLLQH